MNPISISKKNADILQAVKDNHYVQLKKLIPPGFNLDFRDTDGRTPLFIAAKSNHLKCIKILKAHGADINAKDSDEMTPLMIAASLGNHSAVQLLVKLGANTALIDKVGWTARVFAIFKNEHLCANLLPNDVFSTEVVWRIVLGHFNGIGKRSSIYQASVKLTGAYSPYMHRIIADSLHEYLLQTKEFFSQNEREQLLNGFEMAICSSRSASEIKQAILNGELTIICTGWEGHAIDVAFFENYLAICNKGDGPSDICTLEVFKIDPSLLNEDIIDKIRSQEYEKKNVASHYFYVKLPQMLSPCPSDASKDRKSQAMQEISPKGIKVGICTVGAGKVAFLFGSAAIKLQNLPAKKISRMMSKLKEIYEDWATFSRLYCLENYLKAHRLSSSNRSHVIPLDSELVTDVWKKITHRLIKHPPKEWIAQRIDGILETFPLLKSI